MLADQIPASWATVLKAETEKPYFAELEQFVSEQRREHTVFPPEEDVFNALKYTGLDDVRVFVVGQDPYHDDGQAHGLCFSVSPGIKVPPSLRNIYKELEADLGVTAPGHGCLESWAKQGVLLVNTVLTVRAHEAASHQKRGWEQFTDAVINVVNQKADPVVFLLWGGHAQKKRTLIDESRHAVLTSAHPSPLSAYRGFLGSHPFSRINEILGEKGRGQIDWQIPPIGPAQGELF